MIPPVPVARPFACSTCSREYQHSSHLRRHEATHSSIRHFKCVHCGKAFGRRDVWRKHSASCRDNSSHEDLPVSKRGQKPRACDACYQSKVSCDGSSSCGRCNARQLQCTYGRVHAAVTETPPHASTPSGSRDDSTKIPVAFLLGLTNPQAQSMCDVFRDEPGRDDDAPSVLLQPDSDPSLLTGLTQDILAGEGFFPWGLCQPNAQLLPIPDANPVVAGFARLPEPDADPDAAEDPFLAPLLASLSALHDHLAATDPSYDAPFNGPLARQVFLTPGNRECFVAAYFRHTHRDLPLVHRPSFFNRRFEEARSEGSINAGVSPPLLLAVFLAGSFYSPPRDCALAAVPAFVRVAEEYVFRALGEKLALALATGSGRSTASGNGGSDAESQEREREWELYEVLQAGLLMHGILFVVNDADARRRARVVRMPVLVDAVRRLGLTAARQTQELGGTPDWGRFVREEARIRLARWTLLEDWHQSGAFHVPPLMTIHEMTGDMTCLEELWEAETAEEFEAVIAAKGHDCWRRTGTLRDGIDALMGPEWPGVDRFPIRAVSMFDLQVLIMAMSSAIGNARFVGLLPLSAPALLRGLDRWEELWRAVVRQLDAEKLRRSGLVRHSGEMCWLARKLVECSTSGRDRELAYFRTVGHESLGPLHTMLRELWAS